ncbi:hypothetical protein CHS0354_013047 [Potamilus streckersoni]|uniref:Aquaporin n=1 Tax=Potamilus streckersoni TaxID=2493646 RepID=A0AAE0RZM4_9BIVA|nr:hypothetical protein CHS0354_013047 [Potamilus streckersoni]
MSGSETENVINIREFCERIVQPLLAEFVGVCLLVFISCMASQNNFVIDVALAHGLTIAMLIIGLGAISGGHFNPAVTLGVALAGAVEPTLALCYFIAQLLGGLLGAALVRGVLPPNIYDKIKGGSHCLGSSVEPRWAIVAEAVLTTLLVSTFLLSTVNRKTKSNMAPLAIGFAVAVGIISGNPEMQKN